MSFASAGSSYTVRLPPQDTLEPAVARAITDTAERLRSIEPSTDLARVSAILGDAAELLLAHEFWQAADDVLAAATAVAPGDLHFVYYRAWGAARAGELIRAIALYDEVLASQPDHFASLVRAGRAAVESGDPTRGRELLERARALSPDDPAVLAALGQLALESDEPGEAITLLESALRGAPSADSLYFPLAMAYRASGDDAAASRAMARRGTVGVEVSDPLIERLQGASAGATAANLRGRAAYAAGRYTDAVREFERALAADPERLDIRLNLAAALGESGDVERAIAELETVVERSPDHAVAYLNLSELLLVRRAPGDLERLATTSRRAAELLPEDAQAQRLVARVASLQGDGASALDAYRRAVAIDPLDEPSYYEAAILLLGAERYREAAAVLEAGVELMPDQGRLLHLLARVLASAPVEELRDGDRAVGYAEAVARRQPLPEHLRTLALAYAEADRCSDAVRVLDDLLPHAPAADVAALTRLRDHITTHRPCRP